ncbi:hypothetical protein AB4Y63_01670 [Leifsonia sp. YAF41]|uniref:hypothetical protein n=1 Tax=Leifsonia sp. YAF41 TaxID=3233086 RepID=UPI003F9493F4
MTDVPQRNMLQGWCTEGTTLNQAWESLTADAQRRTQKEFEEADTDDIRAASYLQVFTTLVPHWRDRNGLQGAADIVLEHKEGVVEVVEITSTLHTEYERERRRVALLVSKVQALYEGGFAWLFHLRHGWATPDRTPALESLASQIAAELVALDAAGKDHAFSSSAEWLFLRRDTDATMPRVAITSWSTNAPGTADEPYLDRLTRFLSTSTLVGRKRTKLQREAELLSATRQHLYLLLASMGNEGGLLPTSPSFLTWGTFVAPPGLTDIWLDGGTGEIYHWAIESGWVFHRLHAESDYSELFGNSH